MVTLRDVPNSCIESKYIYDVYTGCHVRSSAYRQRKFSLTRVSHPFFRSKDIKLKHGAKPVPIALYDVAFQLATVPAPPALILFGVGLAGIGFAQQARRKTG